MAVSRDLPILTSFSTPEADNLALFDLYSDRCKSAGVLDRRDSMPFFRFVYLSDDEDEAREYPRKALTWVRDLATYRRTLGWGNEIDVDLDDWKKVRSEIPNSYESELENTAYFMTPERCVERINFLQREHGVGYFGASMSFGTMEHAQVMKSMELFARDVMPRFR